MNGLAHIYTLALHSLSANAQWFALLIAFIYVLAAVLAWRSVGSLNTNELKPINNKFTQTSDATTSVWIGRLVFVAVFAHVVLLALTMRLTGETTALNLGFAQALSITACVGVLLYLIESYWVPIVGLLPAVLSLPIVAVLLAAWVPPTPIQVHGGAAVHVVLAIVAHGLALLACGHALLLLALNRVLKNNTQTVWAQRVTRQSPPLVVLERILIRLCVWVAILLLATTVMAWWGGWGRWNHKTVFTVLSLVLWALIPYAYYRLAWRSNRLFVAVYMATGVLLMAYIGSRFVMQAILQRAA